MKALTFSVVALLVGLLLLLGGCSESTSSLTGGTTNPAERGSLSFTIAWPQGGARVIPDSTAQITVEVMLGETMLASASATRQPGQTTATITMNNLPIGRFTVRVNALDAQGVRVATSGNVPVTIQANQVNTVDIELQPYQATVSGKLATWSWMRQEISVVDAVTKQIQVVPVSPGSVSEVSITPDGNHLLAISSGIRILNFDGTEVSVVLHSSQYSVINVAMSQDGSLVAFTAYTYGENGSVSNLYVINTDGTNLRQVTNNTVEQGYLYFRPKISPDNRTVIFNRFAGDWSSIPLFKMNIDGTGLQQLTEDGKMVQFATFSPNGSKIAYGIDTDLHMMNADGSGKSLLLALPGEQFPAAFSPDGSKLAFNSGTMWSDCDLYMMNLDGSNIERLTENPGYACNSWGG